MSFNTVCENILESIISNIDSHKQLCLLKQTNSTFYNLCSIIIDKKYREEKLILTNIIKNIDPDNEFKLRSDSIELFKYSLTALNLNDYTLDIFYCDCPRCFNTEPCGRGNTQPFNELEHNLLSKHLQYDWWNNDDWKIIHS